MCLPAPKGRASKNNPTPVMAEFCHQLLTAHQAEASRAFVPLVTLLEKTLADAVEAGVVRPGFGREDEAGVILSTIMFNAAYALDDQRHRAADDGTRAAEEMWELRLRRHRDRCRRAESGRSAGLAQGRAPPRPGTPGCARPTP